MKGSSAERAASSRGAGDDRIPSPYAGRTFVIINPAAGHDALDRLRRRIGGAFAARNAPFDIEVTERPGHATELARDAVRLGYRAVAVAGGDGTLAEAATALANTEVPLAILPSGTGNQVASALGVPLNLEGAVDVAVRGKPSPMDLGRIDGRYFALVAGAGFDAAVMAAATRRLKERIGFAAYVVAAVKEALAAHPVHFHLEVDGKPFEISAVSVMLTNTGKLFPRFLPFAFPLGPEPAGSWHDGRLDVVVVAPNGLTGFAEVLWKAARRQFNGNQRLIHFHARSVTIEADPPVPVQIDGDRTGTTPVSATIASGALRVLLPDGREGKSGSRARA